MTREVEGGSDKSADSMGLDEDAGINLILQAQFNEIRHYQSMARGTLAATIGILTISIAALSTFYLPFPVIPTDSSEYSEAITSLIIPIGLPEAQFLVAMNVFIVIMLMFVVLSSILISLDNAINIILADDVGVQSTSLEDILVKPRQIIQRNNEILEGFYNQYMKSGLRLIFVIIMGFSTFLIYHLITTLDLGNLFALNIIFSFQPISKPLLNRYWPRENEHPTKGSIFSETMEEGEGRWDFIEVRSYEKWLFNGIGLFSFIAVVSWISMIVIRSTPF